MTAQNVYDAVDSRANIYALRCFCITMAAFFVAWVLNQLDIFIVDKHTMTLGLIMSAGLFAVCLGLYKILGPDRSATKYMLLAFIIGITTVIEIMLTYHSVILSVIPIVYSSMYSNVKRMTAYTFLLTLISVVLIVFGGYAIGLCDANMALLTSKPLADYIGADGLFTLREINPDPLLTLSLYFVFPRCVLCGVFVPICNNIARIIAEGRLRLEEMRQLAEVDGMTGLYNKSKYLELVSHTYTQEEQIGVIFWDMNGLKRVNDTFGHEIGDQMIVAFAESVKEVAEPNEYAFRVGGDEFVMILRGAGEEKVQAKVEAWQKALRRRTVANGEAIAAAVGSACGKGSELERLIKLADERMYANKREFHSREKEQ